MRFLICNVRDPEQLEIETMHLGRRRRQLRLCTEALGGDYNMFVMQNKNVRQDKSLKEDAKRKSVRFGWRVKI